MGNVQSKAFEDISTRGPFRDVSFGGIVKIPLGLTETAYKGEFFPRNSPNENLCSGLIYAQEFGIALVALLLLLLAVVLSLLLIAVALLGLPYDAFGPSISPAAN